MIRCQSDRSTATVEVRLLQRYSCRATSNGVTAVTKTVMNTAARTVFDLRPLDRITPGRVIATRIDYKPCSCSRRHSSPIKPATNVTFSRQERNARLTDRFYRAMHFSAKRGLAIACRLSVCLSVCEL